MSNEIEHENTTSHGSYEREDLSASTVLYFLLGLAVFVLLCFAGMRGLFVVLDRRERALQPPLNPLVTNVPADTRHIAPGYPQSAFPDPKLEEDERGQLDGIRLQEERTLYSYGWSDEKAGTVHIPIEHAMELIVQRGLPVRPQDGTGATTTSKKDTKK